jgi:hypothetical protein
MEGFYLDKINRQSLERRRRRRGDFYNTCKNKLL